MGFKIVNAPYM